MSRLDDANEDLNFSMNQLKQLMNIDERNAIIARAVICMLGSIAVTLAMMFDRLENSALDGRL